MRVQGCQLVSDSVANSDMETVVWWFAEPYIIFKFFLLMLCWCQKCTVICLSVGQSFICHAPLPCLNILTVDFTFALIWVSFRGLMNRTLIRPQPLTLLFYYLLIKIPISMVASLSFNVFIAFIQGMLDFFE